MTDHMERRRNLAPWWAFLFALGALGCNVALFVGSSAQSVLPVLSILLAAVAVIFLVVGLKRAFGQPQIYRGRALSVVLAIATLLPVALTAFSYVMARKLPDSAAAPQIGQKVPDFTLADTSGNFGAQDFFMRAMEMLRSQERQA